MTNDEAIYVLKNAAWLGSEEQAEKVSEAVRLAIEALKKINNSTDAIRVSPPVLPTYINTHPMQKNVGSMQDCVERRAVIDTLERNSCNTQRSIEAVQALPSVQPETCEGCKHLDKWENEVEYGYPSPCTRCKRRVEDHYER